VGQSSSTHRGRRTYFRLRLFPVILNRDRRISVQYVDLVLFPKFARHAFDYVSGERTCVWREFICRCSIKMSRTLRRNDRKNSCPFPNRRSIDQPRNGGHIKAGGPLFLCHVTAQLCYSVPFSDIVHTTSIDINVPFAFGLLCALQRVSSPVHFLMNYYYLKSEESFHATSGSRRWKFYF